MSIETLTFSLRRALIPLMLNQLRKLILDDPRQAIAWIDEALAGDARDRSQRQETEAQTR